MATFDYDVVIDSGFDDIPSTQWNLPGFQWFPGAELYGIQRMEYLDDVLVPCCIDRWTPSTEGQPSLVGDRRPNPDQLATPPHRHPQSGSALRVAGRLRPIQALT
jgi:hypothetical protein